MERALDDKMDGWHKGSFEGKKSRRRTSQKEDIETAGDKGNKFIKAIRDDIGEGKL